MSKFIATFVLLTLALVLFLSALQSKWQASQAQGVDRVETEIEEMTQWAK